MNHNGVLELELAILFGIIILGMAGIVTTQNPMQRLAQLSDVQSCIHVAMSSPMVINGMIGNGLTIQEYANLGRVIAKGNCT